MNARFTLEIKLGNALMRNGSDVARALREISEDYKLTEAVPLDEENDFTGDERSRSIIDDNGAHVGSWRITYREPGEEIARRVLDEHCIKPDWQRSGEQIAGLIAEAVAIARGEQ